MRLVDLPHVTQGVSWGPASNPEHSCSSKRSKPVEQFLYAIKLVLQVIGPSIGHVKYVDKTNTCLF